jgi:type IV secretory pathway protease TraF
MAAAVAVLSAAAVTMGWLRGGSSPSPSRDTAWPPPSCRATGSWSAGRLSTEIRRGHVIVVAAPGGRAPLGTTHARRGVAGRGWIIKRAAAVPGDLLPPEIAQRLDTPPGATVPPGRLLVLGDNPAGSTDSRTLGYIPGEDLLGVAIRRLGN